MDSLKLIWHRITNWEYWPFWMIYYPLFPVWLYYSFKARSLFFFNAANPAMKNGGMAMESKMEIYKMIPPQFIPKTVFIPKDQSPEKALERVLASDIGFPFIAKPDIGMKAFGVEKSTTRMSSETMFHGAPPIFWCRNSFPTGKK